MSSSRTPKHGLCGVDFVTALSFLPLMLIRKVSLKERVSAGVQP
jgi:hypothetical protein